MADEARASLLERLTAWAQSVARRVREAAEEALPEDRPDAATPAGGAVRPEE